MAKEKRNKKTSLKEHKTKNKEINNLTSMDSFKEAAAATVNNYTPENINKKFTEISRVCQLKCTLMMEPKLPYLEYIELRDEIYRLNAMKDILNKKAEALGISEEMIKAA